MNIWYCVIGVGSVLYTLIGTWIFVTEVQGDAVGSAFGWCNQRPLWWVAFISAVWPLAIIYDFLIDSYYWLKGE